MDCAKRATQPSTQAVDGNARLGTLVNGQQGQDTGGWAGLWNTWIDKVTGEVHESYTMLTINADAHPSMSRMHWRVFRVFRTLLLDIEQSSSRPEENYEGFKSERTRLLIHSR